MIRSSIAIVIPAYNEASTISAIVLSVAEYGVPIIVDDGSCDGTGELTMALGAVVVKHVVNRGYDQALNSGFACANELGYKYVVTMDADGQHDSTILHAFVELLDSGADVVLGIRDCRQRIAEHIFAWISSAKWGIRDPLCGMKAYRMDIYRELGHFDSYGSIGTELAIYAAKRGKNIAQLAVKTQKRTDVSRFGGRFFANMRLLRALWYGIIIYN